ncbi:MAG: cyanophycin synthetase [Cyanobacteriota bacterium]
MQETNKPKNFVTEILKKLAPTIGATLLIEPEYEYTGLITFSNKKKVFYRNTRFNINPLGSVEVSKDKNYTNFFLKHFGYNITENSTFFNDSLNEKLEIKRNIDDGYIYAKNLGFPVIIKPNNLSQGVFVTKVFNKKEYYQTAKKIFKKTKVLVVEKYYAGNDYRIVVLDGEVISAYQREALTITGDGKNTIYELLEKKQLEFIHKGRDTIIDFEDYRIKLKLKRSGFSFDSVIKMNDTIQLLDNANLSTGGNSYDFTNKIHPDYSSLAINISKDMDLRLCGVDIMTNDLSKGLSDYVVIEINSSPGLDNYASLGEKQVKIVEDLYLKILKSLEKS